MFSCLAIVLMRTNGSRLCARCRVMIGDRGTCGVGLLWFGYLTDRIGCYSYYKIKSSLWSSWCVCVWEFICISMLVLVPIDNIGLCVRPLQGTRLWQDTDIYDKYIRGSHDRCFVLLFVCVCVCATFSDWHVDRAFVERSRPIIMCGCAFRCGLPMRII